MLSTPIARFYRPVLLCFLFCIARSPLCRACIFRSRARYLHFRDTASGKLIIKDAKRHQRHHSLFWSLRFYVQGAILNSTVDFGGPTAGISACRADYSGGAGSPCALQTTLLCWCSSSIATRVSCTLPSGGACVEFLYTRACLIYRLNLLAAECFTGVGLRSRTIERIPGADCDRLVADRSNGVLLRKNIACASNYIRPTEYCACVCTPADRISALWCGVR